jgi:hypothetical protein
MKFNEEPKSERQPLFCPLFLIFHVLKVFRFQCREPAKVRPFNAGEYQPAAVRAVEMPKANGRLAAGSRQNVERKRTAHCRNTTWSEAR